MRNLGQIALFAIDYAPDGWTVCDGKPLPISEYDELFSLLGTRFGGDGRNTFAVPDFRKAAPSGCNYCISLYGVTTGSGYIGVVGETLISVIPKPRDSEECIGQTFRADQYRLLFTYLGNRFGGDGTSNYRLPDLRPYLRDKFPADCYYLMYAAGDPPDSQRQEKLYIGELTLLPFDVKVKSLGLCNGALMKKQDNTVLFNLLGKKFGGDGVNTFGLPNLGTAAPSKFNYYITLAGVLPPRP